MRPVPYDDSIRVPEPPENELAFLKQNVDTVLHLKPFCTLQKISIPHGRGLRKQNDLISRK